MLDQNEFLEEQLNLLRIEEERQTNEEMLTQLEMQEETALVKQLKLLSEDYEKAQKFEKIIDSEMAQFRSSMENTRLQIGDLTEQFIEDEKFKEEEKERVRRERDEELLEEIKPQLEDISEMVKEEK